MLPVAAGVRGTIKNDETRPSDGGNVEGVRRCLRERSFVPRAVVYHQRGWLFLLQRECATRTCDHSPPFNFHSSHYDLVMRWIFFYYESSFPPLLIALVFQPTLSFIETYIATFLKPSEFEKYHDVPLLFNYLLVQKLS